MGFFESCRSSSVADDGEDRQTSAENTFTSLMEVKVLRGDGASVRTGGGHNTPFGGLQRWQ